MWINNLLIAFLSLFICGFVGQLAYTVFLNTKNTMAPKEAEPATSLVSFIIFLIAVFVIYKIQVFGSLTNKGIDEREILEKAFRENNYEIDYNAYFKDQVKKRLWSYYLAAALVQIPLIINYALVNAVNMTLYEAPIAFYKFFMPSLFAYQMCGDLWFLGALIFVLLFSVVFTALVYIEQKKWLVKPSYLE